MCITKVLKPGKKTLKEKRFFFPRRSRIFFNNYRGFKSPLLYYSITSFFSSVTVPSLIRTK